MKDFSNMSDFEINQAVFEALGYAGKYGKSECNGLLFRHLKVFNPVSLDSDCMPLAWENKIRIDWLYRHERWGVAADYHTAYSENPRRAICEVFLMLKAAE